MNIPLWICAVASLLTGCAVGPDYVRPGVLTPDQWRIDYPMAAEVSNIRWWEQFDDAALNGLIETALRENQDVRAAAARVDQFNGALVVARSQFYPQIGYWRRRQPQPLQLTRRPHRTGGRT